MREHTSRRTKLTDFGRGEAFFGGHDADSFH